MKKNNNDKDTAMNAGVAEKLTGIQLDLKYHMYNKQFLLELADWLPQHGINTVLLEYEDKFPFRKYPFLSAPDAFTVDELQRFLERLRRNGLWVIPLVQTLSHLEFALDHDELSHLRELPDIPTMICPRKKEAVEFIEDLINEVLEFHRDDPMFHLGADETWFLGSCPECRKELESKGKEVMWIEHEKKFLEMIIDQGKRPIVWDDIFWSDPEKIIGSGLPQETILHGWNYGITSLDSEGTDDLEFGGKSQKLGQIDVYHQAGYETIGAPCCNYGTLFPRHDESIGNTHAWFEKMALTGMRGIINTSWACFHVPLQSQLLYFDFTGRLGNGDSAAGSKEYISDFFKEEFGVTIAEISSALSEIGRLWEIAMPGFGRSFTPNPYSYMNMVLHYPGRQEERRKRGAYPLDWDEIDFKRIYLTGVREVRKGKLAEITAVLDQKLRYYPEAVSVFGKLAKAATRNRARAEHLLTMAELKLLAAKTFSHLLRKDHDPTLLKQELISLRPRLTEALKDFFEPEGQQRMFRAWWEPLVQALEL